jgi:hypothetical protein
MRKTIGFIVAGMIFSTNVAANDIPNNNNISTSQEYQTKCLWSNPHKQVNDDYQMVWEGTCTQKDQFAVGVVLTQRIVALPDLSMDAAVEAIGSFVPNKNVLVKLSSPVSISGIWMVRNELDTIYPDESNPEHKDINHSISLWWVGDYRNWELSCSVWENYNDSKSDLEKKRITAGTIFCNKFLNSIVVR